jgi:RNase adapter protein RapZ
MAALRQTPSPQEVLIVTGPAGAGRSTAIRALEDLGFEAIDNLPLSLIGRLLAGPPVGRPLVIGVDPRTRDFGVTALEAELEAIAGEPALALTLVYVDCAPSVLIHRYNETRRRHPSAPDTEPMVGIEREVAMLAPLKARADVLIDTTAMTPHDLRAEIARLFDADRGDGLVVTLQSFSYKRGLPSGVDMVMDVRFLRNPHWVPELRPFDGRDPQVAAHVEADPRFAPFMARLEDMAGFLLPAYRAEGKAYFGLGIGCSGGRHRSVMVVERLAKALADAGWRVSIRHRELVDRAAAPHARDGVVVN